ncbi:MAG: hypothetical protein J6Z00_00530 [Clostridia bacterium]|nr:hypothetical protein [Clostridia bacterium]
MKRVLVVLFSLAMMISMMSIVSLSASAASTKGPSGSGDDYVYYYDGESTSGTLYNGYGGNNTPLSNVSYNKSTNTLTFNNANYPNIAWEINEMGTDFSINLIGKNSFKKIVIWGFGYGGSLRIKGTGSLELNKTKTVNSDALSLEAEDSPSTLVVDPTVTLSVFVGEPDGTSVTVYDTQTQKNMTLPAAKKDNIETKSKKKIATKKSGILYNSCGLYSCTPKSGSGFDASKTYYADYEDTIYVMTKDTKLNKTIAVALKSNGKPADSSKFDITNNMVSVPTIVAYDTWEFGRYKYTGSNSSYTGSEYYLEQVGEYSFDVYRYTDSSTCGTVLVYVSALSEKDVTPIYSNSYIYSTGYVGDYKQVGKYLKKASDGKYYYVNASNGQTIKSTLLVKHTDDKWYYVKNGVVTKSTLLFKHTDGKWYYVKNGVVTKSTLLFKHTDGKYYYVKSGVVTKSTLLFKHTDGKYYYVKSGVVTKSTLLFKHTDGKWYYVKNGVVTKSTLIYKFNGAKRYIKAGVWQSGFSGKVKINGKTYTVKKGNVA